MKESGYANKIVLVLEDEPSVGQVFWRVLRQEGYDVDITDNGEAAVKMAEGKNYDHCLIDIRTPGMSGMEFFMWLQDRQPALAEQVIFTTGDTVDEETQAFLEKTTQPFLPKPFTPEEMVRKIRETWKEAGP